MTDKATITIPADLQLDGEETWTPFQLRRYAESLECCVNGHSSGAALFRDLADEIERQAPRPVGWYSLRAKDRGGERLMRYWNGDRWQLDEGATPSAFRADPAGYVVEPVTIGASS